MFNNKTTIAKATTFENNELLSLTTGSSLQKNISYDSVYKEEFPVIVSPILRCVIEKIYKDEGLDLIKPNKFKPLSIEDAKLKLEELSQFQSEITELKKDVVALVSQEVVAAANNNINNESNTKIIEDLLDSLKLEAVDSSRITAAVKSKDIDAENSIIKFTNKDQSAVLEINEVEALAKIKNFLENFKDKNLKYDEKWENLKRKLDLQVSQEKEVDSDSLSLSDMNSINETFIKNKDEIVDTIKKAKPLGELGEITLNQIIEKGGEVLSPLGNINNISIGAGSAFTGISLFFMYKGVVRLFDSLAFKDYPKNISPEKLLDYKKMRARELKTFMILGAPFIVGSLYAIKQVSLATQVNVDLESKGTADKVSSLITSSPAAATTQTQILSAGKINDSYNSQTTSETTDLIKGIGLINIIKNKLPNWLKYILLIIISFISLYYISKFEGLISEGGGITTNINSILLNNIIYMKLFFVLGSISSFIMSFYYILNIFLFIKFSKNKNPADNEVSQLMLNRFNYLPQFIKDWVKFIEKMSKYEDNGYYIEFYLRLIIVYLLIFLMCVTILIKLLTTFGLA